MGSIVTRFSEADSFLSGNERDNHERQTPSYAPLSSHQMRLLHTNVTRLGLAATMSVSYAFCQKSTPARPPRMAYIQNKAIRLGVDLNLGGSITYLAPAGHPEANVVNSADLGRQIQLSFYSGPVPYHPVDAVISDAWKELGWNPIQSGDYYGNPSKILQSRIGGNRIYIKCIPMHWPLKNIPGECTYEVWLELVGNTVRAHCRLTNKRDDMAQYSARGQELPAVYVNALYYHLITYSGDDPFANRPLTEIHNRLDIEHRWATWLATENWAAQVDDQNWGLGIWNPGAFRFSGGFFSQPGKGGPLDSPTGYIAPNRTEILDHDIVYDFNYVLILGNLEEIRGFVYRQAKPHRLAAWRFGHSREGWSYENATDSGWPIRGTLNFKVGDQTVYFNSPEFAAHASDIRSLAIEAAIEGPLDQISLDWKCNSESGYDPSHRILARVLGDGKYRTYRFPFTETNPGGLLSQIRFAFSTRSHDMATIHIRSVRLER